jgi:SAM-dependent methyltransferase
MDRNFYATLAGVQKQHWWYAARRTILQRVLERVVREGVPSGTLYDLGCGVGANLPVLEKFGPTVGVDFSPEAVAFCHEQGFVGARQADLNSLEGLDDDSGSIIVLADVIEHLDDEALCLHAAHRALAPGGALIVTVPAFMFLWGPSDEIVHHRRRYTAAQLRRVIEPLFEIEHLTYFNMLLFGLVSVGRLVERVLKRGGDEGAGIPGQGVNTLLRNIFAAEAHAVTKARLPFGVSILCIARKR